MLPDRSKRYAGIEGQATRLRLVRTWQLVLTGVFMAGLLRAIFPQQALVQKLYDQEQLDELTLSYVENLYRTQPDNADLKILLARTRPGIVVAELEALLAPVIRAGDVRQRSEARLLALKAYESQSGSRESSTEQPGWRARQVELVLAAARDEVPAHLAGAFAAAAFRLGRTQEGLRLLRQVSQQEPVTALVDHARESLAQGRHELAAEYFLLARDQTTERDLARVYFQKGIAALMAANRFEQAITAADRSLGDLDNDAETLRYLVRVSLAAGKPERAASYAARLVFPAGDDSGARR